MKKISTLLLLVVVTLYGVAVANPSLALADQNSNKDNQSESKSEVKNNFSWGRFVSSLRSNINSNKFFKNKDNKKEEKNDDRDENKNKMASTTPRVNLPKILFATSLGLKASTTDLIWVTNKPANSKIWFGITTPVATTTAPIVSSSLLSYFHDLSLPNLATSTVYFYTISSTDASGNTGFFSNSFTTPAI